MMRWKRMMCLLLAGGMLAMSAGTVWADSDDDEAETGITGVSLRLESKIRTGGSSDNVSVTTGSDQYAVDQVDVINMPKRNWEAGDKPEVRVTLEAEYGYYFDPNLSRSDIDLSGSGAKVSQVTGKYSTLWVDVELDRLSGSNSSSNSGSDKSDDYYGKIDSRGPTAGDSGDEDDDETYDGSYDLEIFGVEWDESEAIAVWEESGDARKYEVRLYRDGRSVSAAAVTTDTQYDFSGDITAGGEYTFKVRAVYNSSNKGRWEESDTWYVSDEDLDGLPGSGGAGASGGGYGGAWLKDTVGWWYCNADKSYTAGDWQQIDGKWYYFDERGYMVTGWVDWQGRWYFCDDSGAMLAGTETPDGYYVGADGAWTE